MHWDNFHIKHTAASQCSIIYLAVWTMRKDFHVIFPPELQKCNHVQIPNGTWVLWDGCGFLSL